MKIKMYQIDAFTDTLFKGNPAAVCQLDQWLEDSLLQNIAQENNLSETAFYAPNKDSYQLRWFTPTHEVDLCGHATLATAHVLFFEHQLACDSITFETKIGPLYVSKSQNQLTMELPAYDLQRCPTMPELLIEGLTRKPKELWAGEDYVAIFENEDEIRQIRPNYHLLRQLDRRGVAITAKAKHVDIISRFFAPKIGINEDPVTGSLHCALLPLWKKKLGKSQFTAVQASQRGGKLCGEIKNNRVFLTGNTKKYMEAELHLEAIRSE